MFVRRGSQPQWVASWLWCFGTRISTGWLHYDGRFGEPTTNSYTHVGEREVVCTGDARTRRMYRLMTFQSSHAERMGYEL